MTKKILDAINRMPPAERIKVRYMLLAARKILNDAEKMIDPYITNNESFEYTLGKDRGVKPIWQQIKVIEDLI